MVDAAPIPEFPEIARLAALIVVVTAVLVFVQRQTTKKVF
jgi:hypothetical protein